MLKFLALVVCVAVGVWAVYEVSSLVKDLKARKAKKSQTDEKKTEDK